LKNKNLIGKNSTATQRIVSGSVASWTKILVGFGTQIFLVPVFLSAWDASTYGVWLLLLAMLGALNLLALSYHDYVGFELLKVGNSRNKISYLISSSLPINILISFMIFGIAILIYLGNIGTYINLDEKNNQLLSTSLLITSLFLMFTTNISGFLERWLIPFGYYPFFAWVRVYRMGVTAVVPAIVAFLGGDLVEAVIAMSIADLSFHIALYWVVYRTCKKNRYYLIKPRALVGLKIWGRSTGLLLRYIIDLSRQMGVRIVMAPLVPIHQITAFATIRTGANISLQGMQSISGAILPELMRFVRDKDLIKVESIFTVFWMMVIFFMVPGILLIQPIMPIFFDFWTLGKVEFNPELFASLSLSVLVFAIAMPFEAIIRGQNLIKTQIIIASIAAFITILGIHIFVPIYGIEATGYCLFISELISLGLYLICVNRWMVQNSLTYPKKELFIMLTILIIVSLGVFLFVYLKYLSIIFISISFLIPIAAIYWNKSSELIQYKIKNKLKIN
jgi:O-antigen/teichoic acid export membrane protein